MSRRSTSTWTTWPPGASMRCTPRSLAYLHHRGAYLLRLRHQSQHRLERHPRRRVAAVRTDLSGAGSQPDRSGLAGMPQRQGAGPADGIAEGKDVLVGVIDVASDRIETPGGCGCDHRGGWHSCRPNGCSLHQLRHGPDAPTTCRRQSLWRWVRGRLWSADDGECRGFGAPAA